MTSYHSWREKLTGERLQPSPGSWSALEARLKMHQARHRPKRMQFILAAAAVLIILAVSVVALFFTRNEDSYTNTNYTAELLLIEESTVSEMNDIYRLENVIHWQKEASVFYRE